MKKFYLLFVLFLLGSFTQVAGESLDPGKAERVAKAFCSGRGTARSSVSMKLAWRGEGFFVFVPADGRGFVIVSASDVVSPILGYSFDSDIFSQNDVPVNFGNWFAQLSEYVTDVESSGARPCARVQREWEELAAGNPVKELVTAQWNQNQPYNDGCPYDGGRKTYTGCAVTAAAIVMRYHCWPETGRGMTEEYVTYSRGITVPSRNLEHAFEWDKMPLKYTPGRYTPEQADAVATLMADIGAAYQADYTSDGTGAFAEPFALNYHFGYDFSCRQVWREDYPSFEAWVDFLKKQMDANGPLVYNGYDGLAGHEFVLDGYTDTGYFHVNWGWGGLGNGYFHLDAMKDNSGHNYNQSQTVMADFRPPVKPEPEPEIDIEETTSIQFDRYAKVILVEFVEGVRAILTLDGKEVHAGVVSGPGRLEIDMKRLPRRKYLLVLSTEQRRKEVQLDLEEGK